MKKLNRLGNATKTEETQSKLPDAAEVPLSYKGGGRNETAVIHSYRSESPEGTPEVKPAKPAKKTDGWDRSMLFL